jgi:hypothetical protein
VGDGQGSSAGRMQFLRMQFLLCEVELAGLVDAPRPGRPTVDLATGAAAPPPGSIDRLCGQLAKIITHGTPGERERVVEALIHEIRITENGQVIPVFKIPGQRTLPATQTSEPTAVAAGSHNGEVGAPSGTRTPNPLIKSQLLCQLS